MGVKAIEKMEKEKLIGATIQKYKFPKKEAYSIEFTEPPIIEKLSDAKGEIRQYRKKPVIIRAIELAEKIRIKTREGTLYGEKGDFLIEGIEGEIYPCGKEIFWKTYEQIL